MSAAPALRTASAIDARNQVILEFLPLVETIARRHVSRLPANVEREELVNVGVVGLLECHDRYDASKGNFKAFAELRIKGAMNDFLRKLDHVPRSVRRTHKHIKGAESTLARRLGRAATEEEVAGFLDMDVDHLRSRREDALIRRKVSLDVPTTEDGTTTLGDSLAREDEMNAEEDYLDKELKERLAYHVANLPERQRHAVNLYYMQGFKLREVGEILGVTESRACQLTRQAQKWLGERLERTER